MKSPTVPKCPRSVPGDGSRTLRDTSTPAAKIVVNRLADTLPGDGLDGLDTHPGGDGSVATVRLPRDSVPTCPGCGFYPHTHNWVHRPDCAAQQIPEHRALANIAAVLGPHLTPQSAAELQNLIETSAGHGDEKGNRV